MPEACLQKVVGKPVRANAFFRRLGDMGPQKTIRVRPDDFLGTPAGPQDPSRRPIVRRALKKYRLWKARGGAEAPRGVRSLNFKPKSR